MSGHTEAHSVFLGTDNLRWCTECGCLEKPKIVKPTLPPYILAEPDYDFTSPYVCVKLEGHESWPGFGDTHVVGFPEKDLIVIFNQRGPNLIKCEYSTGLLRDALSFLTKEDPILVKSLKLWKKILTGFAEQGWDIFAD